ncbi:P3N-PIPO fusion protein, partial [Potato virus B]
KNLLEPFGGLMARIKLLWKISINKAFAKILHCWYNNSQTRKARRFRRNLRHILSVCTGQTDGILQESSVSGCRWITSPN